MADKKQLAILKQGVDVWNKWREDNPDVEVYLRRADLSKANLSGANLIRANLWRANLSNTNLMHATLSNANLRGADLSEANLSDANLGEADLSSSMQDSQSRTNLSKAILKNTSLHRANLSSAILHGAKLRGAKLTGTRLYRTDLTGADLRGANLSGASLIEANLTISVLTNCRIYGISAWNLKLEESEQSNLVITRDDEPTVTVDDLEVAQFVYLLLNNKKIRNVLDTITSKVVLILGRFTKKRKAVLDALRDELRKSEYDFVPVVFDFDKPASRDLTETVSTLAHMARFVIADITDAQSIPQELQNIIPNLPSLPIQPIILDSQYVYGMFQDFGGFLSVLPPYRYQDTNQLLMSLSEKVIGPALDKAEEIAVRRKEFEHSLALKR